jgi:penicillin amidase
MVEKRLDRAVLIAAISACLALSSAAVNAKGPVPANSQAEGRSHGKVTIYRDSKGVPHIFGGDSAAVMFGLGYAMVQDRLVQLELARRYTQGRRAELLGASAVSSDMTSRDRLLPASELMRMYGTIPKEHQVMMQSFVDGVNREIAEINADPLHKTPYEFKQWGIRSPCTDP